MQKHFYLQKDLKILVERINEAKQRITTAAREGADAMGQNSESWHDNPTYEESMRLQAQHAKQRDDLVSELTNAEEVVAQIDSTTVVVGSRITLLDLETNEEREFLVSSYAVYNKIDPHEVSYMAPIVRPFFNEEVGEIFEIEIKGVTHDFELIKIT